MKDVLKDEVAKELGSVRLLTTWTSFRRELTRAREEEKAKRNKKNENKRTAPSRYQSTRGNYSDLKYLSSLASTLTMKETDVDLGIVPFRQVGKMLHLPAAVI